MINSTWHLIPKAPSFLFMLNALGAAAFTYNLKYDTATHLDQVGLDDGFIGALFYMAAISFLLASIHGYHYQLAKTGSTEHPCAVGLKHRGTVFGGMGCLLMGMLCLYGISIGLVSVFDNKQMLSEHLLSQDPSPEQVGVYFGVLSALIIALSVFAYMKRDHFSEVKAFIGFGVPKEDISKSKEPISDSKNVTATRRMSAEEYHQFGFQHKNGNGNGNGKRK